MWNKKIIRNNELSHISATSCPQSRAASFILPSRQLGFWHLIIRLRGINNGTVTSDVDIKGTRGRYDAVSYPINRIIHIRRWGNAPHT